MSYSSNSDSRLHNVEITVIGIIHSKVHLHFHKQYFVLNSLNFFEIGLNTLMYIASYASILSIDKCKVTINTDVTETKVLNKLRYRLRKLHIT